MSGRRQGRRSLLTYYPQHYRLPGPERITTRIMTCFYDPGDSNIGLVLVTLELTFNPRFFRVDEPHSLERCTMPMPSWG